jgi:F1F0 ATPase subunit 2
VTGIHDAANLAIRVVAAAACGGLLAAVYFGGLWWTVRRLPEAKHPWGWYFGSLLLRVALIMAAFFLIIQQRDLPLLAACLVGFLGVRVWLVHSWGRGDAGPPGLERTG